MRIASNRWCSCAFERSSLLFSQVPLHHWAAGLLFSPLGTGGEGVSRQRSEADLRGRHGRHGSVERPKLSFKAVLAAFALEKKRHNRDIYLISTLQKDR